MAKRLDLQKVHNSICDGAHVLNQIQGHDAIVLIGKTGTGKSTLIQAISGRQLNETVDEYGRVVYDSDSPLAGFEIGHGKISQTKHLSCFVHKNASDQPVMYLDSPGFEDTDGVETDLATAAMLKKVAASARSLRFVVLINCASLREDRGGALNSVVRLIHSMVDNLKSIREVLSSCSLIQRSCAIQVQCVPWNNSNKVCFKRLQKF